MIRLRISEIFYSLQGETATVGIPTTFVRLAGCPLRCRYCDTAYAWSGGTERTLDQVLDAVSAHPARFATVTGGEPLDQPGCLDLLTALCDRGYRVNLETGGAHDIAPVDARVSRTMDLKTPGSGESARNRLANIAVLRETDEVKFVITDRADYDWARAMLDEHRLAGRCPVLFSPAAGLIEPRDLAQWILDDGLPVRFQLQLHKILWGSDRGR